jgi:Outer membrane protein beta-barrel domain
MRTILLAAAIAVVTSMPRLAQAQSFEIGVKGGVTFATQTGGTEEIGFGVTERILYDTSLAIGGAFAFGLTERVAFQPEMLFVQKAHETQLRGSSPDDPFPLDVDGRVRQNYLELPMLLRLAMGARGIQLLAGPSVKRQSRLLGVRPGGRRRHRGRRRVLRQHLDHGREVRGRAERHHQPVPGERRIPP